jgi:hypothetical protein
VRGLFSAKLLTLSYGYHSFNLIGLVELHKMFPEHKFWESKSFEKIRKITLNENYISKCYNNPYAFEYNVTGYELIYFCKEFQINPTKLITDALKHQLNLFDSFSTNQSSNISDPITLKARIYELTKLL